MILDFLKKLEKTPSNLDILGDGTQKSYLHVEELIEAMTFITYKAKEIKKVEIVNIGCSDNGVYVKEIAEIVRNISNPNANLSYGESNRGWVGDVPKFHYDISYSNHLVIYPSILKTGCNPCSKTDCPRFKEKLMFNNTSFKYIY